MKRTPRQSQSVALLMVVFASLFAVALTMLAITAVSLGDVALPSVAPAKDSSSSAQPQRCEPFPAYEDFLTRVIGPEKARCQSIVPAERFQCASGCTGHDVELDTVAAQFSRPETIDALVLKCRAKEISHLVRFASNKLSFVNCAGLPASQAWKEAVHLLFTAACIVQLPDVVFGFEDRDYVPITFSHPLMVRFVGVDAHPAYTLPTSSFIVAACHCKWRESTVWWRICGTHHDTRRLPGDSTNLRDALAWADRDPNIAWRGFLPTGVEWAPEAWLRHPRAQLVRGFAGKPGFNVGLTGETKFHPLARHDKAAFKNATAALKRTASIPRDVFPKYRYLVRVFFGRGGGLCLRGADPLQSCTSTAERRRGVWRRNSTRAAPRSLPSRPLARVSTFTVT